MEPFTFRKTRWGMGREEVAASEGGPSPYDEGDTMAYESTILGYSCTIFYSFANNSLVSASYYIDHPNDVADVGAYLELSDMLKKKYGEPELDAQWKDPWRARQLDTFGEIAKAVSTGELRLSARWSTPQTLIWLTLTEDRERYNAIVMANYTDASTIEIQRQTRQENDYDLL